MRFFNHCIGNNRTVLEHILKIYEVAVMHMLCEIIGIMEVNNAVLVSLDNILRKKNSLCNILRHFACHIITLNGIYRRIFIGVFLLNFLVIALYKRENLIIGCICLTNERTGITVLNITLCYLKCALRHNLILDNILNFLYRKCTIRLSDFELYILCDVVNLSL